MDRSNSACRSCALGSAGLCTAFGLRKADDLSPMMRDFKSRSLIHRKGQPADHVAVMCEGYAIEYSQLASGRRQILTLLGPGDTIHWPTEAAAGRSVLAVTNARVAHVSMERIAALAARDAGVFSRIVRALEARRAELCELAADIGRRTAHERICRFLLKMTRDAHASLGENEAIVRIPLKREEIADYLGMTPTHVNRVYASLREQGLISVRSNVYTIRDVAKLTEAAG